MVAILRIKMPEQCNGPATCPLTIRVQDHRARFSYDDLLWLLSYVPGGAVAVHADEIIG